MLKISELSIDYGSRPIVRGISLEVGSGEVLALIGPNGAGKSTLIRAVSSVIPIRAGRIEVDQMDMLRLSPMQRARRIAVVPQAVSLPPAFTVWETVLLGRTPYLNFLGHASQKDEELARHALEQVDAWHLRASRIDEISGGEQQRVLLARSLAQDTPMLLMDEPTAHLDLPHQIDLLKLIVKQARLQSRSVLIALHDLNLASMFADRVALIQEGKLSDIGTPREILTSERLRSVYPMPLYVLAHPESGSPIIIPGVA